MAEVASTDITDFSFITGRSLICHTQNPPLIESRFEYPVPRKVQRAGTGRAKLGQKAVHTPIRARFARNHLSLAGYDGQPNITYGLGVPV